MPQLRQVVPALMLLAMATGILTSPRPAGGQSVLERTPNLHAGWTGIDGTLYFNFLHRFWNVDAGGQNKVVNSPTFFLALPLPGRTLLGVDYSSNSLVDGSDFNEYEVFARWTPLSASAGHSCFGRISMPPAALTSRSGTSRSPGAMWKRGTAWSRALR